MYCRLRYRTSVMSASRAAANKIAAYPGASKAHGGAMEAHRVTMAPWRLKSALWRYGGSSPAIETDHGGNYRLRLKYLYPENID